MNEVVLEEGDRRLLELAGEAGYSGERIVIKGHGVALAALVPMEDLELIERVEGVSL